MRRTRTGLSISITVAALLSVATDLSGQVRRIGDGRALDANPLVGSGGFNVPGGGYQLNRGNLIITGNITGGRAFQGFSPIRDSSQLLLSLPSSTLSDFMRDSTGVNDVLANRPAFEPRPFFFPQQTVTNVGAIEAGLNLPGTSVPRSSYVVPRMDRPRTTDPLVSLPAPGVQPIPQGDQLLLKPLQVGMQPVANLPGAVNPQLLSSPLFARNANLAALTPLSALPPGPAATGLPADLATAPSAPGAPAGPWVPGQQPLAERTGIQPPDGLLRPSARLGPGLLLPESLAGRIEPTPAARPEEGEPPAGPPEGPEPAARTPTELPAGPTGQDAFQDMLNVLAFRQRLEQWRTQTAAEIASAEAPSAQVPTTPRVAPPSQQRAAELEAQRARAREFLEKPIGSFVGTAPTAVNERLREAEEFMAGGEYYRAAGRYEIAHTLDPRNPLPLLGRAHALIGAGQYLSAVNSLCRAIQRFPQIVRFRLDLTAFIPDAKLLEIRRAYLESRLREKDDYRLRFLLGYIEYHTELAEFGMDNLKRAAAAAPADSPIARFPELVRPAQ